MTVRLAVSVEGATEREFVSQVLAPHLEAFGIFAKPIVISGHVGLASVRKDVRLLARSFPHVTTLYDFYAFPQRPDTPEGLEKMILDEVDGNGHVIPYVQVHEFEALIFSGPDEAAGILGKPALADDLRRILRECGEPESINSRYDTCPSRRLKKLFPAYDKVKHGCRIIERIGLAQVRQTCPRFSLWLSRLESLVP